jgi:predicted ATPase
MSTSSAHLPLSLSVFVGRKEELAKLHQLEQLNARLMTLVGPGGAGKTRLASEFVRQRMENGKRAFFVDLTREATVAGTILDLLQPGAPTTREAAIAALRRHASPGLMIVLDGLEHVAEEAATMIPAILGIDGVVVLCTSRESLRLRGEQVIRVGALSEEEAIELFELRARSLMPDFDHGKESGDAIREIVARVDGLPLGIELAAARVNVLPPRGLAERLTNRMSALRSKDRDRPERHRSIAATARWSFDLLGEQERMVLIQLGAFRGNFTLQAAEKVVYLENGDVIETVEDLVDRSIVEPMADGTFRIFQTMHGFAVEELASDDWSDAVYERHARYFVGETFATPRHRRGERSEVLMELILAANRTSGPIRAAVLAAKGSIVAERGGVGSFVDELVGAMADADSSEIRAELQLAAARGHLDRMELPAARRHASVALETARDAGLPECEVQAHLITITSHVWNREYTQAGEHIDAIVDAIERTDSVGAETQARSVLARLHLELGDVQAAEDDVALALHRARAADDEFVLARTLSDSGMWRVQRGQWADAESLLSESIALFDKMEDSRHLPGALLALARIKTAANDLDSARELYLRTERVARDFGLVGLRLDALIGVGSLRHSSGDRAYLVRAIDIARDTTGDNTEFLARSMLLLFDMRFSSIPLARHQARRIDGGSVPDTWVSTVKALSSLLAGWEGDDEPMPEDDHPWVVAVGDVVRLLLALPTSGATSKQVADVRAAIDAMHELSGAYEQLAEWPTEHVVHVLDTLLSERYAAPDGPVLKLDRAGRSFTPPNGEEMDYSRRGALRRVLVGLAEHHGTNPGVALTLDDVLELGWPGEIVTPEAGASRVYSAIRTLRNHGLDDILNTNDEGYLFDPELTIEWTE